MLLRTATVQVNLGANTGPNLSVLNGAQYSGGEIDRTTRHILFLGVHPGRH